MNKKIVMTLKILFAVIVLLAGAVWAFMTYHPVWGGTPDEGSMARIRASKAYNATLGKFENQEPTQLLTTDEKPSITTWITRLMASDEGKNPSEPLPSAAFDKNVLKEGEMVWFGHSTVLFKLGGLNVITDPVFHNASPIPYIGISPFKTEHSYSVESLPELDIVLLSHDHYDHLDYRAIQELDSKTKHFIVPLGVKAHLQRWGVADDKITEMDWDEQTKIGTLAITLVPARHFSGRMLNIKDPTLWGGYIIQSPELKYYYSADSGYGKHYRETIAKHAPFDFVMIENGAYDKKWALIHETPEEALQALKDIGATKVLPIHWGKFDMANHVWTDPINRLMKDVASQPEISVATPKIGQIFHTQGDLPAERWWQGVR